MNFLLVGSPDNIIYCVVYLLYIATLYWHCSLFLMSLSGEYLTFFLVCVV